MSDAEVDAGTARASSALALRTPAAARRAPSFFPTGHSEGWKVFSVAFGAPLALGVGVMTVASGLGIVGVVSGFLGAVASPFGALGANHWFQERGKSRLRRAKALYLREPERGLHTLARVVESNALPEIRLEAAARIAVHALERGKVAEAIEALSIQEQDLHAPRRRRNWEAGLRAEVLRAILAWLSPGSFIDSGIAPSDEFKTDDADDEGLALLAALRLLERASEDDEGALAAAWNDMQGTTLEAELPSLYMVVLAVTAERLHHLLEELRDRLRKDGSGIHHGMLRRLFPRMQILVDGGYRHMMPDEPPDAAMTSLAVVAPTALQMIAQPSDAESLPVSGSSTRFAFLSTYGMIGVGGGMLTVLAGGPVALGVGVGVFTSLYVGTPIAAIWGSRRKQRRERARRVAPLARLDPRPPQAWLTECASGPPGPVTRTSGYRRLEDLPPSQMVLYVAAMQAEQALARGDIDHAWEQIEWWFSGFSGKVANSDPFYAIGSSLVRVAALTGRRAAARRLLAVMPEVGNEWDGPKSRTIYGNAPRAVSLVSALLAALDEQWDTITPMLQHAREAPRVFMTARDHVLMAEIVRRSSAAGVPLDWSTPQGVTLDRQWVQSLWPESLG